MNRADKIAIIVIYNTLLDLYKFNKYINIILTPDIVIFPMSDKYIESTDHYHEQNGRIAICPFGPSKEDKCNPSIIDVFLTLECRLTYIEGFSIDNIGETIMINTYTEELLLALEHIIPRKFNIRKHSDGLFCSEDLQ